MALIKCSACKKKISDKAEACPHCGCPISVMAAENEEALITKKQRKKKRNKLLLIVASVLAVLIICVIIIICNPRYKWNSVMLSSVLPQPESAWGDISSNSNDYLYLYVHKTSTEEYNSYLSACVTKGFDIEATTEGYTYEAYNADGYKLQLYYYPSNKEMTITLEAPIKMNTIQWATSEIAKSIPTPKSTKGRIDRNDDKGLEVYLGNTSIEEYNDYVTECESKGFTLEFSKQENSYSAQNAEGYQLNVRYEGGNVMFISIIEPQKTLDLYFSSMESEYEYSVYIDDSWECDVEVGENKTRTVKLGLGKHIIKIRSDEDWDVYKNIELDVTQNETIRYEIRCTKGNIEINVVEE